ncbi:MAG: hypothetical protein M3Q65_12020 [Chloroflexota bacterium]|nr:hypothetical protein [Chloroflexota bacterium]
MSGRHVHYTRQEPYKQFGGGAIRHPCLFVELSVGAQRTPPILAIVDSGADTSVFHTDVATALLGLDLKTLRPGISSGSGGLANVYHCPVTLHCQRRDFTAEIQFNPTIPPSIALLGREDFFRQFLVGFDQRRHLLLYSRY